MALLLALKSQSFTQQDSVRSRQLRLHALRWFFAYDAHNKRNGTAFELPFNSFRSQSLNDAARTTNSHAKIEKDVHIASHLNLEFWLRLANIGAAPESDA